MSTLMHVHIYTDGACSGNPGPGGWAAILKYGEVEKELAGFAQETTNNRMELTGVVEGLKALRRPCRVTLYVDSAYIYNAITQDWIGSWKRNGWTRGKKREELANVDLWQEIDRLLSTHQVSAEKVKGHAGHTYNERADRLAVEQIRQHRGD